MDAPTTYRLRGSQTGVGLVIVMVMVAVGLVVWNGQILPFGVLICVFAWFVFLAWPYPTLRLDAEGIHVRNPYSTRSVPYALVADVTGGGRLQIELRGGAKVVATAISGNGVYLINAARKNHAYGQYVVPVRNVDDLRIDAGQGDTASTRVAQIIRRRMALAPVGDKFAEPPAAQVNWATIAISVGLVIALVGAVAVT